jgi:hypothetical protein
MAGSDDTPGLGRLLDRLFVLTVGAAVVLLVLLMWAQCFAR